MEIGDDRWLIERHRDTLIRGIDATRIAITLVDDDMIEESSLRRIDLGEDDLAVYVGVVIIDIVSDVVYFIQSMDRT